MSGLAAAGGEGSEPAKSTRKQPGWRRPDVLLARSGEAILVFAGPGRVCYVNPAWEALAGLAASEVVGGKGARPAETLERLAVFEPPPEAWDGRAVSARLRLDSPEAAKGWRRVEFWPLSQGEGRPVVLVLVRDGASEAVGEEPPREKLREDLMRLREEAERKAGGLDLIGRGPVHRRIVAQVEAAGAGNAGVWITGPPGSGKRLVARAIHRAGPGRDSAYVVLDCRALPSSLLESELRATLGGRRGTLVLAGVEDLPRDLQKLVAEDGAGGGAGSRLIGLSETGPTEAIDRERVREDLGMRLSAIAINLPPLRDRKEELPVFAQHFLERSNRRDGRSIRGFDPAALDTILAHDWPGNLAELQRAIGEAAARATGPIVGLEALPPDIRGERGAAYPASPPAPPRSLDETLEQMERALIEGALRKARHNKARAARMLGVSRPRLHRRIKELGIEGGEGS